MQAALGRVGVAWMSTVRLPSAPNRLPKFHFAVAREFLSKQFSSQRGSQKRQGGVMEALNSSQEASAEMELEKKKCVPCEKGKLQPMSKENAHTMLTKIPHWEIREVVGILQLHRDWKAKSFVKGLEILKEVADVAEAEGHHPDLHLVNWNQLSIDISTHSIGGLTENDFIVAAKISALDLSDLVRKPKAKAKEASKPPPLAI